MRRLRAPATLHGTSGGLGETAKLIRLLSDLMLHECRNLGRSKKRRMGSIRSVTYRYPGTRISCMKCANLAFVVTPPRRFPKAVTAISPAWREQYHSATAWAMGRAEDASALCSPIE